MPVSSIHAKRCQIRLRRSANSGNEQHLAIGNKPIDRLASVFLAEGVRINIAGLDKFVRRIGYIKYP